MLSVISNSCSKDPRLPREPIKSGDPRSRIRGANQKRGSSEQDSGSQSKAGILGAGFGERDSGSQSKAGILGAGFGEPIRNRLL